MAQWTGCEPFHTFVLSQVYISQVKGLIPSTPAPAIIEYFSPWSSNKVMMIPLNPLVDMSVKNEDIFSRKIFTIEFYSFKNKHKEREESKKLKEKICRRCINKFSFQINIKVMWYQEKWRQVKKKKTE